MTDAKPAPNTPAPADLVANEARRGRGLGRGFPAMPCPHCQSKTMIRGARVKTRLYRDITYQCTDPVCGFTFVAALEAVRPLSPSGRPNPRLTWPVVKQTTPKEPYDPPYDPLVIPPDDVPPLLTIMTPDHA